MNILVINGSPRMERSNSLRMTRAFLEGLAKTCDTQVEELTVAKMHIEPCLGCLNCWKRTPGKCFRDDDMAAAIESYVTADLVVWSFPLYYYALPGQLKCFLDRTVPINRPVMCDRTDGKGNGKHVTRYDQSHQRHVLISTCGFFSPKGNYDAVLAQFDLMLGVGNYTTLFCGEGEMMPVPPLQERVEEYLCYVRQAGEDYGSYGTILPKTRKPLEELLLPKEKFEEMGFQKLWDPDKVVLIYDHLVPASQLDDTRHFHVGDAFAEKYGIKKVYDNYNDMFTDPDIDVIYITTPHNTHINFMRRAIENGKHILVEKSITLNSRELDEAIALADKKGVVIGEAMTIYHMPIYKKLKEILESGKLGKVNLITMNFGSFKEYDMNNRFFNKNLAGGAMLDIGVYALSFIRWFMDSKPDQLLSQVKPAPTGVDEQAGLLLMNQEGQMASVMLSLHSKQPKRGMVSCEKGYIEIMEYPRAWEARITYTDSGETEVIQTGEHADALAYELADMEKAIRGDAECMHLDYTKDVMDMMTEFRKEWGFQYPEEM